MPFLQSVRPIRISDSTLKMDEDAGARLRIQQLINILMAVDTEFRVRGLRDPSHVAFMTQLLNTFRAFPLQEQERQLHSRIQILRRILDVDRAPLASKSVQAAGLDLSNFAQHHAPPSSSSNNENSGDGSSTFDAAKEPQVAAIREREENAFTRQDVLARYRSYRRFAIGIIRSNRSASFRLMDLHSAFEAARKEAIAQQSDNLPPHFKLTRSDNIFSNRVMKFSDLRRAAEIGDLDGLTCEIINRVKFKGRVHKIDAPPAAAAASHCSSSECGLPASPFTAEAAMAKVLTVDLAAEGGNAHAAEIRRKRQRALLSPEVRADLSSLN